MAFFVRKMSSNNSVAVNRMGVNTDSPGSNMEILREISELKESLRLEKSKKRDIECELYFQQR